jgi:hypothetical protein
MRYTRAVLATLAVLSLLITLTGCLGNGGLTNGDTQPANETTGSENVSRNVGTNSMPLGNRSLMLEEVSENATHDGNVVNATVLADNGRFVIDYSVRGDMRIEPALGDNEIPRMHRSVRRSLYGYIQNSTEGDTYVSLDGRYYRVTVGDVWAGEPTIDPSDPQDKAVVAVNRSLGNVTMNVTVGNTNGTVYRVEKTLSRNSTAGYNLTRPGNYSLKVEWGNRTVTGSFNVTFRQLADCNRQTWSFILQDDGYRFTPYSTLLSCRDPADTQY